MNIVPGNDSRYNGSKNKTETFWNVQDKAAEAPKTRPAAPVLKKIKDRKDERLMEQTIFDRKAYAAKAREAVAEGSVLLRNEAHTLPFAPGTRLAVFGRSQFNCYKKSGTGSGGLVNTGHVPGILEALEQSGGVQIERPR